MTKDEAEAIHALARQLLEEDVSVETRCRLARKIIEHARAIKASCMGEPTTQTITVNVPPIATPTATQKQIAKQIEAGVRRALSKMHSGGPVAPGSVHHENEGRELFQPACRVPAGWTPSNEPEQGKTAADCAARFRYGTPIPFEWAANKETTHIPANYG